jgi:hypothetical protein
LIEIGCSVTQEEAVQAAVEASCQMTGDLLIGHRVNEETQEVMLLVRLLHATSVSKHATALSHALQQHDIASFRFVAGDLVNISFDPMVDPREQIRDFPLGPDESWFIAIHDQHQVYVRIGRPVMGANQAAWLLEHEVVWAYVEVYKNNGCK